MIGWFASFHGFSLLLCLWFDGLEDSAQGINICPGTGGFI